MERISNTVRTDFDPSKYSHNGNFVYPGVDAPIQTVHLYNLRDEYEDVELFRMLDSNKVKQIISSVVSSATSYALDPIFWTREGNWLPLL